MLLKQMNCSQIDFLFVSFPSYLEPGSNLCQACCKYALCSRRGSYYHHGPACFSNSGINGS